MYLFVCLFIYFEKRPVMVSITNKTRQKKPARHEERRSCPEEKIKQWKARKGTSLLIVRVNTVFSFLKKQKKNIQTRLNRTIPGRGSFPQSSEKTSTKNSNIFLMQLLREVMGSRQGDWLRLFPENCEHVECCYRKLLVPHGVKTSDILLNKSW